MKPKVNKLACVMKDGKILGGSSSYSSKGVSKNTPKFISAGAAKAKANQIGGTRLTVKSILLCDDQGNSYFYSHDYGLLPQGSDE